MAVNTTNLQTTSSLLEVTITILLNSKEFNFQVNTQLLINPHDFTMYKINKMSNNHNNLH